MSTFYDAFDVSPVPAPGPDAVAPEPFRGIYGMPAFVTVETNDLAASTRFWERGLGFFDLFSIPGRLVHLRRWAFQDVLLVPSDVEPPTAPSISVSFACVLGQVQDVARACRAERPDSVTAVRDTPWNTRDVEVLTPEGTRVTMTAAKPLAAGSQEARDLEAIGISTSDPGGADTGVGTQ